ncbi:branched-chain amino acid ABC transporter permease [Roseovarius sp. 217]|jgi:branched-chain amino acid transport system permease protein|uniref:branched-chain amino acid ABC transporter permease n=1 Tax=Roseovarius sp. (strain 217) TaxID=314264 RepID=UPI0000684FCE|nr:branched-chain amino acid ABC transporter permease [Roseovarius sp. 217]EAQ23784.1 high-affinity branched-chain amino acid ABC transporter, permease protein [Roseovarius sp. 217]
MSDANRKDYVWHNPLAVWGTATGNEKADSIEVPDPRDVWDENRAFKVPTYKVGRLKHYIIWPTHGDRLWNRMRWWPTRRNLLHIKGQYNRKTLAAEKKIIDRRPIYWALCLLIIALGPLFFPADMMNTLMTAGAIFGVFAAINVCWTLIIGTASIFSLATYAVVGTAGFISSWVSIKYGIPWYFLPFIGSGVGLIFGAAIAIPALRLDGFYYALLTLGLNELCRVFFTTSNEFGSASGGLYGASTFVNDTWEPITQSMVTYYSSFALLIGALFLFRLIHGKRLGRILRMAPEKREAFAAACGVDYKRARITIFVVTSIALGFIGGFYSAQYRGIAFSIFGFDTVLLGLAMLAIGGIGKAEGAILGTLVVVFLDKVLLELGPIRHFMIGALMLGVVLFLNNGYFGIKQQFNAWRDKKRGEWRSSRSEKGGEALPEEATEIEDKDDLYFRRFDKLQRDYLKGLVTPQIIEEHRKQPLGQHSEALERVLLYFRRAKMEDKYALHRAGAQGPYKIIAFSGVRGVSPRLVDDREYATLDEGYHGVFMRRVHDLMET